MQKMSFNRKDTDWFSDLHLRLVYDQKTLEPFITEPFSEEAIQRQIERKSSEFSATARETLVHSLIEQYREVKTSELTQKNIDSLKDDNTFTITTGHQLSLYTGPLYFVVKILHVIKMCDELNAKYTDKKFIPVYWMATEDHDFEEIQSFNIFNRSITWESSQKGPVGQFNIDELDKVKEELRELFGNHPNSEIHAVIDSLKGENYAKAFRKLVNQLFGDRGLVIVDGDDVYLKQSFSSVFENELKNQFSYPEVHNLTNNLLKAGGKAQVTPREINLFYSEKGLRSRIVRSGGAFSVEGKGEFSLEQLLNAPEKLSPNVILRPLYQETILPNLAYIGGGGEISYWLQLKEVFKKTNIVYPLIQVRNSVVWLDKGILGKLEKVKGSPSNIFKPEDTWKKEYLTQHSGEELDMSGIEKAYNSLSDELRKTVLSVDKTKESFINAELARMKKQLESIQAKAVKFSKANHDQAMKSIEFIKSRVNPNGGLQERSENFFRFCKSGEVTPVIHQLYLALDPFNGDFIVILESS